MSIVKKVTFLSILTASIIGMLAKMNYKKHMAKKAAKKNLLSFLFKFAGSTFNLLGYKFKSDSKKNWRKAFMFG